MSNLIKSPTAFVRSEYEKVLPVPHTPRNLFTSIRSNFFSSAGNSIASAIIIGLLVLLVPSLFRWSLLDAVWTGGDRQSCLKEGSGACWAFVTAKFSQFMYGRYPVDQQWRVNLSFALLAIGLFFLLIPKAPYKRANLLYLLVFWPMGAFILLTGQLGLPRVDTSLWGGLLLTLVISIVATVVSFPLGLILAFGRRSSLPLLKYMSVAFIELWRGVPLITVLFMSSVLLPLFLPTGWDPDKLLRALVGISLFTSAYMAEAVRGGLQAVPKAQIEAAMAIGLNKWQTAVLIVIPQALRLSIPAIVNTVIGLFKDTSLVLIIGLFDLLGIVQLNFTDPNWATPQTPASGYVFVAILYWIFCFAMSQYSKYTERRLDTGQKR